jgi:hypothetical protein
MAPVALALALALALAGARIDDDGVVVNLSVVNAPVVPDWVSRHAN